MGSSGKKKSKDRSRVKKNKKKKKDKKKHAHKSKHHKAIARRPGRKTASRPAVTAGKVRAPAAGVHSVSSGPGSETAKTAAAVAPPKPPRKSARKSAAALRRESFATGEILIPGGPQAQEEVQYFLRGCVAAERPSGDAGVTEVMTKRVSTGDPATERQETEKLMVAIRERFETGSIEPLLPARPQLPRRTFITVIDRARLRRREIGAFLRGLDIGHTESSHLDSHGEDSLETLMKWAARLEKLTDADEPEQADYNQYHRFLDQIESTTEALVVDVEATLRRLRDKLR